MIDVKAFVETLEKRPVAVFGIGISNLAAIKALSKAEAKVVAWDDHEEKQSEAEAAGAKWRDLMEEDLFSYGCLVMAPGIPLDHPIPARAKEAGVEIICDLEILHRCGHGRKVIGITGTNGKSTTTALCGHVLNECGIKAVVGGNIGKAALDLTLPPKGGVIVLEVSSFQMDLCTTFTPDIAVHLNFSPDHIDRHGSMEGYFKAKERMFSGSGDAVIGIDDEWSKKLYADVEAMGSRSVYPVSVASDLSQKGVYVRSGHLYDRMEDEDESLDVAELTLTSLPGVHNHQNAAAAYAACRLCGLEPGAIISAMKSFPGLAHRQYLVRVINGVSYINDSKATNVAATIRALECYKNIYWIVGGLPKEGGLNGAEPYMDRVRQAFLIGESMEDFASWLHNHGVTHHFCKDMNHAVNEAHRAAQADRGQPGGTGTVLLSPACASFDQYTNFEERGDDFTALVEALPEETA